jgi:hypothetical protein
MVNDYKKYFIFNGKKSSDFDVWASGLNIFHSPERRIERIQVPGRNGELLIEDGSFENTELLFKDCFIPRNFSENFTNLSNYLNRQKGYQRLELSWLPDEYRLAAFHGDIEASMKNWDGMGKFDLSFNCKPQRFLKSGEEPITLLPMRAEGLTTIYSPKYTFPTWTEVIPVDAYRIGITLLSDVALSYKVRFYLDGDPEYVDTEEKTLTIGERVTELNYNAIGWQVIFTKSANEDIDNIQVLIDGHGAQVEDNSRFSGILCTRFYLQNPTGFVCKPVFDVYGGIFTIQGITQANGEAWEITSNDYSHLTSHVIIDCENEYMYYYDDGVRKNLTSYITIEHTDKDSNVLPPSFPAFGEDETLISAWTTATNPQTEGMMIRIYPHWYTI